MSAHPWEEIRGIGTSFGYNRVENLNNYLSTGELVHLLITIVANGGNLCLNIGPKSDGTISVIMQQRLTDIGKWLKINGEAIYGTSSWKNSPKAAQVQTIFYTAKGNDLFVLNTKWQPEKLVVPGIKYFKNVSLLGSSLPVKSMLKNGVLTIQPPSINPLNNPCNDAWVYKIEGALKY